MGACIHVEFVMRFNGLSSIAGQPSDMTVICVPRFDLILI
jgi:hypothetical protein